MYNNHYHRVTTQLQLINIIIIIIIIIIIYFMQGIYTSIPETMSLGIHCSGGPR